jgi:hypothetical protein
VLAWLRHALGRFQIQRYILAQDVLAWLRHALRYDPVVVAAVFVDDPVDIDFQMIREEKQRPGLCDDDPVDIDFQMICEENERPGLCDDDPVDIDFQMICEENERPGLSCIQ